MNNAIRIALTLFIAAGCATMDGASSTPPQGVVAVEGGRPRVGTRWIVKATSFNENTSKTQVQDVTWTVIEEGVQGDTPVVRIWNGHAIHVHDRASGSWMAALDRNSNEIVSHSPHDGSMSSPLWVGKEWVARSERHERVTDRPFYDIVAVWNVKAFEEITVPAGTYKAFRVEAWPDRRDPIRKRIYWYAPDLKIVVKEMTEGFGRPYEIGVGRDRLKHTIELVRFMTPAESIPAMTAALRDPATRVDTLWQLARIGSPAHDAMPALIEVLRTDPTPEVRIAAANAVSTIGVTSADVPALAPVLGDGSLDVRIVIGRVLTPHVSATRAVLERGLRDQDVNARRLAALALGGLGRVAPNDALPLLTGALDDADPLVRTTAVRALVDVGAEAMPALRSALRHADARVRVTAAETILSVSDKQTEAIAALDEVLADPDAAVRAQVVGALGSMGPAAHGSAEKIKRLAADDSSPEVRTAAQRALEDITPR